MKTFEEFLKEEHSKNYMGTDDSIPEAFSDWLSFLSADDLIMYADDHTAVTINFITETLKKYFDETHPLDRSKESLLEEFKLNK